MSLSLMNPSPVEAPPKLAVSSWLQVISHLDPSYGGIAASLPPLCRVMRDTGWGSPIIGFCDSAELRQKHLAGHHVTCVSPGRLRWMLRSQSRRKLAIEIDKVDGVHIHGLWEMHCAAAARVAHKRKRPYMISAHGMLERWALQNKKMKKAFYATLIETKSLHNAACLRALTHTEVGDYRRIGLKNPIAVVPNGVEIPSSVNRDLFLDAYPGLAAKRIVLFLGRLHHKKGLDNLINAWLPTVKKHDGAHLVIAGPDFENTRAKLETLIEKADIREHVTFTGMLAGAHKWSALAAAQAFILPSYSEGFSMAVLEALGMRVPVIVTKNCNIPQVAQQGCGWVIEPNQGSIEHALNEFFRLPHAEASAMGARGKRMIDRHYQWAVIGAQMAEVYTWMLGGNKPSSVELM